MMLQEFQIGFQPELIPQQPLHLLIVEDVMADVELVVLSLESTGFRFTYDRADTAIACQQLLRAQTYDAVLSDYRLPGLNGMQMLKILQESGQEIPLILVTGTLGEEGAVECIKAGMTDYVLKERLFRLPMVLARALQEYELRKSKQAAIAKIQATAWREATINRIVQTLRGTLVLEEILQTTANQLQEVLQVSHCLICQLEGDRQVLACQISKAEVQCPSVVEVNWDFLKYYQEKLAQSEPVVLNRINSNLPRELQESARVCGIRSLIVAPLLYQQSYLGEITLYQDDKEREWTVDELALVTAIADQCAIAIHQAKLYQQAQTEITRRKRLEEVLRQQAEQLEQANRLKDEFLAIVSHELRTPLSTILTWSQLLQLRKQKLDEATIKKAIEIIERSAKAQVKIVDDILDVSRMIRGNIRLNTRSVNLSLVISSIIEDMRPIAEAKGIRVESVLDHSVGSVWGDLDRLQQIVWNLLSNAVKFTPQGGRVQVRLSQELKVNRLQVADSNLQPSTPCAQIQVTDTGIGINPNFMPYVFERFLQADSTTTRVHGGLGLGLAIVRHLVELHGGTVHVASEGEGKGATFTVQLPIQESLVDAETLTCTPSTPYSLNGLRALVVDDDADTCEAIAVVLDQYRAQVTVVTSAEKALAEITSLKPDVLISDIGMPDKDGYWLIASVRALEPERGGEIPAIALTAFARDEDRIHALMAGFQMYVPKPVQPVELVAVVANLVGRS